MSRATKLSEAAAFGFTLNDDQMWILKLQLFNLVHSAENAVCALTFWQRLDGVHDGLWNAHLLDADVCRVVEHLRNSEALVGQPQDLLSCLVLSTEHHLLSWLEDRKTKEEER